jgi:EpsI family protein
MKKNLRYILMLLFLLVTAAFTQYLTRAGEREQQLPRTSLAQFPAQFAAWQQHDAQSLGAGQLRELKTDDYLSRTYFNDQGATAYLFIGYYASQRHRQTFHSPQNCIPGSGWTMGNHRQHKLDGGGEINEYLIAKDDVRMLAFYWYHGRGRIVASDYWGRFYTVSDAIRSGRTDGALVRVIVPMGKGEADEARARAAGLDFATNLLPLLPTYIPN